MSFGLSLNSQRCLDALVCSSRHFSLIAAIVESFWTEEFMQSCFREARGMCFTNSRSVEEVGAGVGYVGGKLGRETSPTN